MVPVEIWSIARTPQGNTVILKPEDHNRIVPIFIGNLETQALLIGLGHLNLPRPLTHDLILEILNNYTITPKQILITRLENDTFFAELHLDKDGKTSILDCRPSDALSLSVRHKIPIYINESIIEEAGMEMENYNQSSFGESIIPEPKSKKEELQEKLDKMIQEERYEEAAVIRDLLKEIEKKDT